MLDAGLVAHVGFVVDGSPVVLPMGYVRDGDELILHGSSRNRMLRAVAGGAELCVTVTLLDGLVLASTAFTHSMNYRSAVIHGRGRELSGQARRRGARPLRRLRRPRSQRRAAARDAQGAGRDAGRRRAAGRGLGQGPRGGPGRRRRRRRPVDRGDPAAARTRRAAGRRCGGVEPG